MPKKRKTKRKKKGTRRKKFRRVSSYILRIALGLIAVVYVVFLCKTCVGRWNSSDSAVTFPEGDVRGIDISHYQGEIDWEKLRNAKIQDDPISFIFVKATQGTDIWDENFNQNFYNAHKNGIIRGAYHYFSPHTSGKAQAQFFCKIVQLDKGDLPPVLDVEETGNYPIPQLQQEVLQWMEAVEKHFGVIPILYTSYKFRTMYLNTSDFDRYPYWIAHYYVDNLQYEGDWKFWQHTDKGKIDGINEDVDINVFNGSYQDLVDLTIK